MSWLQVWQRLRQRGILGMNCRNARCILDLNPRQAFPVVDEKLRMHRLCQEIGVPTPDIYLVLKTYAALRQLPKRLERFEDFVLKPNRGAAGRGILVVVGRDGDIFLRHNGQRLTTSDLCQHVSDVLSGLYSLGGQADQMLVQQRVLPDPAFTAIAYNGIPDIRVILYKQVPVMAMLRLPTRASGGRANLHQGGVGAGVDLRTGVTTRAVLHNRAIDRHPDTGASVLGFPVPCWPAILAMAQRVSQAVALGYLGVDIVLDAQRGPLLLEANARPGLAIQIANGAGLLPRLEEVDRQVKGPAETWRENVTEAAAVPPPVSLQA